MSQPWMPLYIGDYLRDTECLSTEGHGAYMLILFSMWNHGGWVPADEKMLARIARVHLNRWRVLSPDIMPLLTKEGDKCTQPRLKRELEKANALGGVRSENRKRVLAAKALKDNEVASTPVQQVFTQPQPQPQEEESKKKDYAPAAPLPSKPKASKGTRWPDGEKVPPGWIEHARARLTEMGRPVPDLELEAERFASYWPSQTGQRGTKLSWPQTFYNWCLNAKSTNYQRTADGNRKTTAHDKFLAAAEGYIRDNLADGGGAEEGEDRLDAVPVGNRLLSA
jgi:uncharacterized protein YdaU (DUF1376 family)